VNTEAAAEHLDRFDELLVILKDALCGPDG